MDRNLCKMWKLPMNHCYTEKDDRNVGANLFKKFYEVPLLTGKKYVVDKAAKEHLRCP
jgi:hypothetical protein